MATIRLIPSDYGRSNTNYVTVTDPSNMYYNTDHTSNYCTLRGRAGRSNNSTYYAFINGFNFDDVPEEATVTEFKIKIRAYRSQYQATGNTSYRICLASQASNSYKIGNTTLSSDLTTSSAVYEIPTGSLTWETLKSYGSAFSIDIPLRNSSTSSNQYPYVYVYGAEIEVTYSLPIQYNVTVANATSVSVITSDSRPYEGDDVYITADTINGIIIKDNNVDVTNQFVQGQSGSISKAAESQTNTGISSGSSYAAYAVGRTAEDPYSSTSNMYSSSGTTGHVDYVFDFSDIPASATISSVTVKANGHAESSTYTSGSRMAEIQLYSGSTAKGSAQHYTSTSNSTMTLSDPGTWTWSELQDAKLRFTVANYGGLICGITWTVQYTVSGYVYTITNISTDHAIVVTSGDSGPSFTLKVKQNGSWVSATKVYVKQNGAWVQASKVLVKSGGSWH